MRSAYGDFAYDAASITDESVRTKYVDEYLPKWLGYFEKLLQRAGGQYFGGSAFSFADVMVFDILDHNLRVDPACLAVFPTLQQCKHGTILCGSSHINVERDRTDTWCVLDFVGAYSCRCDRSQTRHLGICVRPFTSARVLQWCKRCVRYAESFTAWEWICSSAEGDSEIRAIVDTDIEKMK
eukprot:COSAG02_NODE_3352_length_6884_cov_9.048342_3_plen_182_part_00